ncbi:hypothetical protein [Evansella cellulosilytica]|uniref:Acyltransferase 3 n=1 Tax=Evansella cellulosilytica (strain ATCC 21833 / DSM 2522 / FERM P-1141 / JCM 9156 / N-4) TaxID=649639 RepID=E6TVR0_EVAC2|nr:hypothetical protein [Evansella cellulosilytica]ADU32188.1 acyltransferase 3 [Evansella cellulosilytica DSM 2522]
MVLRYLRVKWAEILIGNIIAIAIAVLLALLLNITIHYIILILGAIGSCVFVQFLNYRKWLRNGATTAN